MGAAPDAHSDIFYSSEDGLRLHVRSWGTDQPDRLPVVCLPGLTRTANDFTALAQLLAQDAMRPRRVYAFDYRGRGLSAYDADWRRYDIRVEAADVLDGLTVLGVERAAFIGTSRGGLILHLIAATRPSILKGVILNDVGPSLESEGLAHIRTYLEQAPSSRSFAEAVAVQKATHDAAFPALSDADWDRMTRAIYRDENGVPVADYDPKLVEVVRAMDLSKPVPTMWPQFEGLAVAPMMVIRGDRSLLLSAATVEEMARRHADCRTVTVEGQGHPPLLETGDLPDAIGAFLEHADETARLQP